MYIIMQNWLYLLIAMLIGALIGWVLRSCLSKDNETEVQLNSYLSENEELKAKLSDTSDADNKKLKAKSSALETELLAAQARIKELEAGSNIGLGIAGAGVASGAVGALSGEEADTIKARNKFLETRIKFLENTYETKVPSNTNFTISEAGNMSPEELERQVVAAGSGTKPKSVDSKETPDDLLLIDGVGPKNNEWLKANGIHYFWQIATMNPSELAWLANNLPNFGSRVYRENWVAQCANLAKGLPPR